MRLSLVSAIDDHLLDPAGWFGALQAQTANPSLFEVIAIDAHRMDGWRDAHEALERGSRPQPRIVYRQLSAGSRAHALNAALDEATGDVVVFLADDFIAPPRFVERHRQFHLDHPEREAVGVAGALIPEQFREGPFAHWLESTGQFFGVPLDEDAKSIPENFFYVGNASVKRALIDAAGRFDEDFPYHCWDDHEYGLRLSEHGMRSALIPEATAVHEHPITLSERRRQMHEAGQSAAIHAHKQPQWYPWLAPGDVPPWRWRAAAWKWRLAHVATRSERHRGLYYDRILKSSFSSGLRERRGQLREGSR